MTTQLWQKGTSSSQLDDVDNPPPDAASAKGKVGLEFLISCQNLSQLTPKSLPNSYVTVFVRLPNSSTFSSTLSLQKEKWITVGRTEIVENDVNPKFQENIFLPSYLYDHTSIVKFNIWYVREIKSQICLSGGVVEVTLPALENNSNHTFQLTSSSELQQPGSLSVVVIPHVPVSSEQLLTRRLMNSCTIHLYQICSNVICKSYEFPCRYERDKTSLSFNPGATMKVVEYMGESGVGYVMPLNYLKCIIQSEYLLYESLSRIPPPSNESKVCHRDLMEVCKRAIGFYEKALKVFSDSKSPLFKRSVERGKASLEFMPVNLHINRLGVMDEANRLDVHYDVITVGSFAAHCRGLDTHLGGLQRLAATYPESCEMDHIASVTLSLLQQGCQYVIDIRDELQAWSKVVLEQMLNGKVSEEVLSAKRFVKILSYIKKISQEPCFESLIDFSGIENELADLQKLIQKKCKKKSKQMAEKRTIVENTTERLVQLVEQVWQDSMARDCLWPRVLKSIQPCNQTLFAYQSRQSEKTSDCKLLTPTYTVVSRFSDSNSEASLSPAQRVTHAKETQFFSDIDDGMQENENHNKENSSLAATMSVSTPSAYPNPGTMLPADLWVIFQIRATICLSQAITAMVAGVVNDLGRWDGKIWSQMTSCGVPLYFESLMSCFSDESVMLEDMFWVVKNLAQMTITVRPQSYVQSLPNHGLSNGTSSDNPLLYAGFLNRRECVITCPERIWAMAPSSIRSRQQVRLHPHPIMFNVGINEMQTIAEKLTGVELQRTINAWGLDALKQYMERYIRYVRNEVIPVPLTTLTGKHVSDALASLGNEIAANHSKPTKILELVQQITYPLNTIRFTSCKSAKDRTSMGVSLEWVHWLKACANLPKEHFDKALEELRSKGLRLENVQKNVGARRYAFNRIQLKFFPELYRPPPGTFGGAAPT